MRITTFFSDSGVPATGLSPFIDVWLLDGTPIIVTQPMVEIPFSGGYYYDFLGYLKDKDYAIRADGGVPLSNYDRYVYGSNAIITSVDASESAIRTNIDTAELAVRDGSDTLKILSDQLDIVQTDLDTPDQYKANVVPLALEDGGRIEETQNHIKHAEYGLQALKAIFDEIKGAGWSDESLVSLSETLEWVLSATTIRLVTVGAGATTIYFTTDLVETADNFWDRAALVFISGQCAGQMRKIHGYNGTTKQLLLYTPLSYTPAENDTFLITTARNFRTNIDDNELIAHEVWEEALVDHENLATTGEAINRLDNIQEKTDKLTFDGDDNIHAVVKDAGTVPGDVWEERTYDHENPDTFGLKNQNQVPSEDINAYKADIGFLLKIIKNKKELKKNVDVWELVIYNDDNVTPILNKEMKDKDGNNITDLEAGILAQELKDSV